MGFYEKLPPLRNEQVIIGRWEGNRYKILRHIGSGGNGAVYLVEDLHGSLKAMKVSTDLFGLTGEYRIMVFLRSCAELRDLNVIPGIFEIDDSQIGMKTYHFIVMEYCQGENLGQFKGRLSVKDATLAGSKVAVFLDSLHRAGFIFGDLKPGNIIYNFKSGRVYVVDYGSVTVKGGRLRQFTPGYDRKTWQAGTRIADERYDIFSLGMLLASLVLGNVSRTRYKNAEVMAQELPKRIKNLAMREAVWKGLTQKARTCHDMVSHLSEVNFEKSLPENCINRVNSIFINLVGLTSAVTFIIGLIYLYQFR